MFAHLASVALIVVATASAAWAEKSATALAGDGSPIVAPVKRVMPKTPPDHPQQSADDSARKNPAHKSGAKRRR